MSVENMAGIGLGLVLIVYAVIEVSRHRSLVRIAELMCEAEKDKLKNEVVQKRSA